jgi:hypothetical protein
VIDVKILVDDDELRRRTVWESTLRQRVADASAVLKQHAGVQLRVVAVEQWDSNDLELDFNRSLREFEQETRPSPAQVAIGFTSQYQAYRGRHHMGGTRGPLHTHILVKERARGIQERERLELLVHELGHFLGASHSPEPTSVMRPLLDRGQQRAAGAVIGFDPANTLAIALIGEEVRLRRVREMSQVSVETRRRLQQIYTVLASELPEDSAATQLGRMMSSAGFARVLQDARQILEQIVAAAEARRTAALGPGPGVLEATGEGATGGSADDSLLDFYVQRGAAAAADDSIEPETAQRALLLALGVALDDTNTLRNAPLTGRVIRELEDESQRQRRLKVLGSPALRGRPDLAKHFFVSAHVVALAGSQAARSAGLAKELADARGGSGFSFADMAANRAGMVFAHAVLGRQVSLEELATSFRGSDYLPEVSDLAEQLQSADFARAFGDASDPRFTAELRRIDERIRQLPAYQSR